jgi:two-component sensor histidine kinase
VKSDWWRLPPGSVKAHLFAVFLVGVATALRLGLGFFTQQMQAFTTFYPAVLFAALAGGAGPGIFAALLGGIVCWWLFLHPFTNFLPLTDGELINLLTYFVASIVIVWATDHYRRLTERLRDEENLRKIAVDELAHRLKNKAATFQAVVNFCLRDHPEVRDEISKSVGALVATDDLIVASHGHGAHLRDILATELVPYDVSRISLLGPNCLVPPRLALAVALLVHELATNAAKYGALSNSTGKLFVDWGLSEERLHLAWRESGGPPVSPPNHSGFGTRLFQQTLAQFDGHIDANFATTGFACKLSLNAPEITTSDLKNASGESHEVPAA